MKHEYALVDPDGRVEDKATKKIIRGILYRKSVQGISGYTLLLRPQAMVGDKIY